LFRRFKGDEGKDDSNVPLFYATMTTAIETAQKHSRKGCNSPNLPISQLFYQRGKRLGLPIWMATSGTGSLEGLHRIINSDVRKTGGRKGHNGVHRRTTVVCAARTLRARETNLGNFSSLFIWYFDWILGSLIFYYCSIFVSYLLFFTSSLQGAASWGSARPLLLEELRNTSQNILESNPWQKFKLGTSVYPMGMHYSAAVASGVTTSIVTSTYFFNITIVI
jgi:hypothetical protein